MTSDVSRIIDSPMVKRGCVPASNTITRKPWRANTAANVEPPMPLPIMATSYAVSWFCIYIPCLKTKQT